MEITKETIAKVAKLSRLELSGDEADKLTAQVKDIVAFVEKINELDTADVPPTYHAVDVHNIRRADANTPSLPTDTVSSLAPESENGAILIPQVIE
ncbi:MAG: Asp-tRNA(Asn)/Glu-tRNA(Gln) amidotransferase subunit GatC [Spirochaetota bacterium]|mgnify:CR=1 FL=1